MQIDIATIIDLIKVSFSKSWVGAMLKRGACGPVYHLASRIGIITSIPFAKLCLSELSSTLATLLVPCSSMVPVVQSTSFS